MRPVSSPFLLVAAPLLGASEPPPPEDPADIRKSAERVGPFALELEEYRDSKGGEMPRQWKKVRMLWRSADGLSDIELLDDGHTLARSYAARSADGKNVCMGSAGLSQYGPGSHFETYARHYSDFLKSCSTDPARAKAYQAELRQALPFYPAAGARLKALAIGAFGRLAPRCIRFKEMDLSFGRCGTGNAHFTPSRWNGREAAPPPRLHDPGASPCSHSPAFRQRSRERGGAMTARFVAVTLAMTLHSAGLAFLVSAQTTDLVSPPAYRDGMAVAQPFALGRCIPMTTRLEDEMVQSYDHAYDEPVYRCTGWRRPLLNALVAAVAASLFVLAVRSAFRLWRRSET